MDTGIETGSPGSRWEQLAVPRAAARVLAAAAGCSRLAWDLPLRDAVAERVFDSLGGSLETFEAGDLRCTAFRTLVIDEVARHFFGRSEGALGVGVWPLLGTRGHRLEAERWVDVDAPAIAQLRGHLLPQRKGWMQLGSCLCNSTWVDAVCGRGRRRLLFVLDEAVLPLTGETMMRVLDGVSRHASAGSELVIAFDAYAPLRPSVPLRRSPALELVLRGRRGESQGVRYPRLRFVDEELYPDRLRTSLAGVNAVACLHGGVGAPALAHLKVI